MVPELSVVRGLKFDSLTPPIFSIFNVDEMANYYLKMDPLFDPIIGFQVRGSTELLI